MKQLLLAASIAAVLHGCDFNRRRQCRYLPDSVAFASDSRLLTANEGAPSDDYSEDPNGFLSISDLGADGKVQIVTSHDFSSSTIPADVRIKPDSDPVADLEPEYIAVSPDGKTAWVSLQANNAVAIVNLETSEISVVTASGAVEWKDQNVEITQVNADGILAQSDKAIYSRRAPCSR